MNSLQVTRPNSSAAAQRTPSIWVSHSWNEVGVDGNSGSQRLLRLLSGADLNSSQATVYLHYAYQQTILITRRAVLGAYDTRSLFLQLSEKWKADTLFESSMSAIITHPDYQKIIGLGSAVIPFILEDLSHEPNHWFAALRAVTRQDPAKPEEAGNLQASTQAWLRWGRLHGYIL